MFNDFKGPILCKINFNLYLFCQRRNVHPGSTFQKVCPKTHRKSALCDVTTGTDASLIPQLLDYTPSLVFVLPS